MKAQLISVVVIGRNEGQRLRACLESVTRMQRGDWTVEVIYVDSGSRDGSPALAENLGARVIALHPERPTAALGRNAGWRAAHGEFVLFLDGDTVLDSIFVAEALREFSLPMVAVVWGHRREMYPERSLYNRVLDLDWIYPPGPAAFCGGDALFLRKTLQRTGGFDETLIAGEEPELCRRILAQGEVILHVDRAMTGHDLAVTRFSQYWRRATRAGHAYAEVSGRFADTETAFWTGEVRRNRKRVLVMGAAVGFAILVSLFTGSGWPLLVLVAGACALVVRTAWKARWKSRNWMTLLLYGVHSQFQQVPIFWGRMRFERMRNAGVQGGLVEYKG